MSESDVQQLGAEIWAWRLETAFRTSDDIPRVDHAPTWVPEFTPASVKARRTALGGFQKRWSAIEVSEAPISVQVDHRLLGSALARVAWELDVLRNWEKDAVFLAGQILGPWFDLLLPVPPFADDVQKGLVFHASVIPARVELAKANLERAGVAAVARVAAETLEHVGKQFLDSIEGLAGFVSDEVLAELRAAGPAAADALDGFGDWLREKSPSFVEDVPVGREQFVWYLRHVALIAGEPEDLVAAARGDYQRAVVGEAVIRNANRNLPQDPIAESIEAQIAREEAQELEIREFYEAEGILSQPESLGRYLVAEMPPYLGPLHWLGVSDDLTSDTRLDIDSVSYMPRPTADLPYFYAANARDPRLGIIHEGAHYKQLALAWAHENPLRRRYYDSVANEGIAHYNEEMMYTAGLFADAPRSHEVIQNFIRLRALRVIVDVNLATGGFTLEEAVAFFEKLVPMDRETALEETAMYVATPGLAMSYHVGKQLLQRLLADAIQERGAEFSLRDFHDYVWKNGNMPFSLQRWELLGDRSDIDVLDAAGRAW